MANNIIDELQNGSKSAITNGLSHPGAIYRMNAIAYATLFRIKDEEIISKIKSLLNDNAELDGYSVASFAKAALDLLGAEIYIGNDLKVKGLIRSNFKFMQ